MTEMDPQTDYIKKKFENSFINGNGYILGVNSMMIVRQWPRHQMHASHDIRKPSQKMLK